MKDKYWALIIIGMIVLGFVGGFFIYKHGFGARYEEKTCPICVCPDNYHKGFEDCKKIYEERINYCFDRCKYRLMVVGGPSHADCMWNCFYIDYLSVNCEGDSNCVLFGESGICNAGCYNKDYVPKEAEGHCFLLAPKSCHCINHRCEGIF